MVGKNKQWSDHDHDDSIPSDDDILNEKIKQYLRDNLRIEKKTWSDYGYDGMVECTSYKLILDGEIISETY